MAKQILTPAERFMQYVEPEPNSGCWLWTAGLGRGGYGKFSLGLRSKGTFRTVSASRAAWELLIGPIPADACVLHRCDVRACVNPDHLFLGNDQTNATDREAKRRGRKSAIGLPPNVSRSTRCNKYEVRLAHHGVRRHLGMFFTIEEATAVAEQAKRSIHRLP